MATANEFEIEVTDEVTLSNASTVEHAEHGTMRVDSIAVGPRNKIAQLRSQRGPLGLELTDEQLREQWGETIAQDPFDLHEPGTATFESTGIGAEGSDVEVDLTVRGPEKDAERVKVHAMDQIVRAIQATRDERPPEECDGGIMAVDWERVFESGSDDRGEN